MPPDPDPHLPAASQRSPTPLAPEILTPTRRSTAMPAQETRERVAGLRQQFPALQRQFAGRPVIYLDAPAGTQVPQSVIDAVADSMAHHNANLSGLFATSVECTEMMGRASEAFADLFGVADPQEVVFGANATSITLAVSRALSQTWKEGDEIVVTDLDHDANITPWTLAARDRGVTVRRVRIRPDDCTLDLSDLQRQLNGHTRLVAVGAASNSVGTRNPIAQITAWAHEVGALCYVDAVHHAPHGLIDIPAWGCDFLVCSAYKFFGPHVGILWGRRAILEQLTPYKVRPAPNSLPGKWMTGTQNHPCIAGSMAAVDYLAQIGESLHSPDGHNTDRHVPETGAPTTDRRAALIRAFHWIESVERALIRRFLDGLAELPAYRVWGILEPERADQRWPTLSLRHIHLPPRRLAAALAQQGIFAWHGNYYALRLSEVLGQEPEGMVRLGLVHYNTPDEVDVVLAALRQLASEIAPPSDKLA